MRNESLIFLFLNQSICCDYSKELSQWDGSFEHPKHMHRSRKFFQIESNFFDIFFSWLGERGSKYHYKLASIGLPGKWHLNDILLASRWWPNTECWLVSLVVLQGIRTNIASLWNPIFLWFFRGEGGPDPCPPSGSAHETYDNINGYENIHNFTLKNCVHLNLCILSITGLCQIQ